MPSQVEPSRCGMTKRWNLDSVLPEVMDAARALTDARYGAVGLLDDSGQVQAVDAAQEEAAGDTLVPSAGGQSRILAVDDEPQVLWLLRNILSASGHKLFGAINAREMMRLLETEQPHLVLLDLMLPDANGFDLMGRIREVSDVPVIFLSGNDQEQNVVRALNMGAEDYITKPFSSTELLARVTLSLRKRSQPISRR